VLILIIVSIESAHCLNGTGHGGKPRAIIVKFGRFEQQVTVLTTDITFIAWNVNGLNNVSDRQYIIDCVVKYDTICFTEVWTTSRDECDSLFSSSHAC
jgi:hypothetical protein